MIKSGSQIISHYKPIILLEINRHVERGGTTREAVVDHMKHMGYSIASKFRNDYIFVPK